jgi:hypothetical protein
MPFSTERKLNCCALRSGRRSISWAERLRAGGNGSNTLTPRCRAVSDPQGGSGIFFVGERALIGNLVKLRVAQVLIDRLTAESIEHRRCGRMIAWAEAQRRPRSGFCRRASAVSAARKKALPSRSSERVRSKYSTALSARFGFFNESWASAALQLRLLSARTFGAQDVAPFIGHWEAIDFAPGAPTRQQPPPNPERSQEGDRVFRIFSPGCASLNPGLRNVGPGFKRHEKISVFRHSAECDSH